MRRVNDEVPDFTVTSRMSKSEIKERVEAADSYIQQQRQKYGPLKSQVLELCVVYAKNNLCSYISKAPNRYSIYSNIMNFVDAFADEIHFLAYVVKELEKISAGDNSSFRLTVLPTAKNNLKLLLVPEVAKTRKAFVGLAMFGMGMLFAEPRAAFVFIPMGLLCVMLSDEIVHARLNMSLQTKMHQVLTGGAAAVVLNDGFEDVFGKFVSTTTSMLDSGMTLFARGGDRFQRLAGLGEIRQAQQMMPASRVELLPDANQPQSSAPPVAHKAGEFVKQVLAEEGEFVDQIEGSIRSFFSK